MKLNCDLGEKVHDNDALIMPFIHMANIACGFHASDPLTMNNTVKLALTNKVTIGAHPSYNDKDNFGRISVSYSAAELIAIIQYQIGAMQAICDSNKATLSYVKPHGALYNDMMKNAEIFEQVCQAISALKHPLPLLIQALPETDNTFIQLKAIAGKYQISLLFEAFADREYTDQGLLVSRQESNAVIHDIDKIISRCEQLIRHNKFISVNGKPLNLKVDTLCVHGDNPEAIAVVKQLHQLLNAECSNNTNNISPSSC